MKSVVCDISCHMSRVWLNWLWQFLSSAFGPALSSSPSICAGISMKTTSRYLIHSLVPLAPGLTTVWHPWPSLCLSAPGFILISLLFPWGGLQTSGWPSPVQLRQARLQPTDMAWVWTHWMIYWMPPTAGHLCFWSHTGPSNAFFCLLLLPVDLRSPAVMNVPI